MGCACGLGLKESDRASFAGQPLGTTLTEKIRGE
jgi:hypothetical protein